VEGFDELRARQLKEYRANNLGMADWVERSGGLYLFGTIGLEAILLSDGTVMLYRDDDWTTETGYTTSHKATEEERIAALVIGSRRMPTLESLLPRRPDGEPDCEFCGGTGEWPLPARGIICPKCNGLGWMKMQ
jgi:hypothetical protein